MLRSNYGINYLLDLNAQYARQFIEFATERRRYRGEHPTEIVALKCMDGRINLPVMTQTVPGIIQSHRNLGGKFNLGWPFFQLILDNWVQYSINRGRYCLVLVTYHYSRGDPLRGCRGFDYDIVAARDTAISLKNQFDQLFGVGTVIPIVCGIETDQDALILHGEDGRVVDLAEVNPSTQFEIDALLRSLYPLIPDRVILDFLPLVLGNINHIAEVCISNRPIEELEHKEWVLGVGRGFDWLRVTNTAFIISPFDPDLAGAIEAAANLLKSNIDGGRVDSKRIILLTCAVYRDTAGPEYNLAKEKVFFLTKFALNIINQRVPDLMPHLQILAGCTNLNTRKFTVLEHTDIKALLTITANCNG